MVGVSSVAHHDEPTTNHTEVLSYDHGDFSHLLVSGMKISFMYFMISQIATCTGPWYWGPYWAAPSWKGSSHYDTKVKYLEIQNRVFWGQSGCSWSSNIIQSRIIVIFNHNNLIMGCINGVFGNSDTTNSRRKDRQGSLLILLIFVPEYSVLQRHGFRIRCGSGSEWCLPHLPTIHITKKAFFSDLLYLTHHTLHVVQFHVG